MTGPLLLRIPGRAGWGSSSDSLATAAPLLAALLAEVDYLCVPSALGFLA